MTIIAKLFVAVGVVCSADVSAAAELPARIAEAGKIVVGIEGKFPPMEYFDPETNELKGFDVDLINEIGKELGVKVVLQDAPFQQLLPSLRTGRVDAVIAGMRDTISRRETVDFVDYLQTGAQFYTLKKWADKFPDGTSLCGRRVSANVASTWTRWINEWSQKNCIEGRSPVEVVGSENQIAARLALKTERVDAAIEGTETIDYVNDLEHGIFVKVGEPFAPSPTGIATQKNTADGEQIRDAIAAALTRVQSSGAYDRLLSKYKYEANSYKPVTINAGTQP